MAEKRTLHLLVNGRAYDVFCDPTARLLDVLREELRLTGNRERIRTLAALHAMHWVLETVRNDAR